MSSTACGTPVSTMKLVSRSRQNGIHLHWIAADSRRSPRARDALRLHNRPGTPRTRALFHAPSALARRSPRGCATQKLGYESWHGRPARCGGSVSLPRVGKMPALLVSRRRLQLLCRPPKGHLPRENADRTSGRHRESHGTGACSDSTSRAVGRLARLGGPASGVGTAGNPGRGNPDVGQTTSRTRSSAGHQRRGHTAVHLTKICPAHYPDNGKV